jgi:hypothetical protein
MRLMSPPIVLHHNFEPDAFMWLWAKYVAAPDLSKHCTACLKSVATRRADGKRSPYSQKFSAASNPAMRSTPSLTMDETGDARFAAIYLCGVAAAGYAQKKNYPHNFHAAVVPDPGREETYRFEDWTLTVENGHFTRIPSQPELPSQFLHLPAAYTTCRIFRWAAGILPHLVEGDYAAKTHGLQASP